MCIFDTFTDFAANLTGIPIEMPLNLLLHLMDNSTPLRGMYKIVDFKKRSGSEKKNGEIIFRMFF